MQELIVDSTPEKGKVWSMQGYNIVAVDVLRATSTIVVALERGAKEVIPCAEVAEAETFRGQPGILLAGERKGEMIPGFDFTNSPDDLSREELSGKCIVLTTSDGTRLITQASDAEVVFAASTLNHEAVAAAILEFGGNWALIGAGSSGDFRPEDKVGCALVGKTLLESGYFRKNEGLDAFIREFTTNWASIILNSLSVQKLHKIGRAADVKFVIEKTNMYRSTPRVVKRGNLVTIQNI